jgi:hypothetical protein
LARKIENNYKNVLSTKEKITKKMPSVRKYVSFIANQMSIKGKCDQCKKEFEVFNMRKLSDNYFCSSCYEPAKNKELISILPELIKWARANYYIIENNNGGYRIRKEPFGKFIGFADDLEFARKLSQIKDGSSRLS